jgi:hypothetical protein
MTKVVNLTTVVHAAAVISSFIFFPNFFNMTQTNLKENDLELTPNGIDFMNIGDVIGRFTDQYQIKRFDCCDDSEGNRMIPLKGTWDTTQRYACLVIDRANERLYFRPMPPTEEVSQEDRIKHRDNFADGFIDYLIDNNMDVK